MKQNLPVLFLFLFAFLFPKSVFSAISLSISGLEKKDDYYIANVTVTGLSSSSGCFVQGMFTSTESSSYFGYTWSAKGEWLKYDGSPEKEFVLDNFIELKNDEPQNIIVKPDTQVSGYKGPGEYYFKVKRFTSSGTSSSHISNIISLNLSEPTPTEVPIQTPSSTPTPTPSPSPTNSPTPTPTPTKLITPTPTKKLITSTPTKIPTTVIKTTPTILSSTLSAILGESTDSASLSADMVVDIETIPTPENIINKSKNYKTPFFIGLFLAISSSTLLYFRHRKD